jgi:hypothetical protein
MPYDLKLSHFSLSLQKDVASGQVVDREGVVLRSVLEAGQEKVQKADGSAATYEIAGFAISDNETIGIIPAVEDFTIPAAPGPYTVQLAHTSLVGTAPNSSVRVMEIGGSDWTEVAGAPAATEFQPVVTTGVITFNVADAGKSVRIWYRANLTVAEARLRFFQRNINNDAGAIFNTVVVGMGAGEIYTAEYDTNVDWSTAVPGSTGVITSGADGILTIGGSGTAIPGARCIHVPDIDQPYLGIAFSLPG